MPAIARNRDVMSLAAPAVISTDMTAVCLTGQLRWSPLTLATLRQFVLQPLTHAWRAYYVGPADVEFDQSMPLLLKHFVRSTGDMCTYDHVVSWSWQGAEQPFELHGRDACVRSPRPRLAFNVDRLPSFGVCEHRQHNMEAMLPHMEGSNELCSLEISMLMQMWQCAQAIALVERAEARSSGLLWHSRVLKLRTDIFFFHPVELPPVPDLEQPWYSLMEDTCIALTGARHMMLQHATGYPPHAWEFKRFISDFWAYGNRRAMGAAMRELLRTVFFNASERIDPKQAVRTQYHMNPTTALLGYYVQPWPFVLDKLYNKTQCLDYAGSIGLVRVNPAASCFVVQARLMQAHPSNRRGVRAGQHRAELRATTWESIDIGEPAGTYLTEFEAQRLASAGATPWLIPAIADLYRRCFGLVSKVSCPRIVGDRQMVGKGITKLERTVDCQQGFEFDSVRKNTVAIGGCAGGSLRADRFVCLDEGLAALLARSRAAPFLNGSSWRAASARHQSAKTWPSP